MREILFKAKRIDNGEWVYGYYFKAIRHWNEKGIHEDWIVAKAIQNGGWCNVFEKYAIDADTICQYTGLNDKNGKKIWENDIVKVSERGVEISGGFIAFFNDYPGGWLITNKTMEAKCCLSRRNDVEVIGNVFDNSELLKGGAE